ncbi:hypothetical protein M9H77_34787 [Catharanthus roseus]|uniref:Uncharacterized protein n=1 Tax=Catharanthus roseus TaxID=4058 RepID=A0ACB9ZRE2_CATRO|nr:hypothetical protein M9H77_34787 [Catharanthus roseus]
MDSFEEPLKENIGFEADEDPNTLEEFLDPEEYIDLEHLFTTDRIFSSKNELVHWAKQIAMNPKTYLIITRYQRSRTVDRRLAQKIYNVVVNIKRNRMQGRNTVEEVLYLSAQRGYTVFYRNREESNVLSDIVVARQTSIAMIRTWPYVLIMDTTYKTNKVWTSRVLHFGVETTNLAESEHSMLKLWLSTCHGDLDTVFLNIDSLIQGQIAEIKYTLEISKLKEKYDAKSNAILKNLSNKISHLALKKIMDELKKVREMVEELGSSGSRSGSGSSSGSSPRGREGPPRSGRGRGKGRNSARSSLSSVVNPDAPSMPFPFNNEFPGFIYEFLLNWKNVVGDGNCGFRVVSNFLFRDENHWVEIRRRMCFDLHHHMNVYTQLFGSVECVTELIRRTDWEEGSALADYWMDTPDRLYVIANIFNLCVLHLRDGCPLPPLQVQWEYHRHLRVSGWTVPYRDRILD